jgi:hypothetical protein
MLIPKYRLTTEILSITIAKPMIKTISRYHTDLCSQSLSKPPVFSTGTFEKKTPKKMSIIQSKFTTGCDFKSEK